MSAANIIQLRQLLTERFPGLRTRADQLTALPQFCWPTGLPQLDGPLRGGLRRGALTEVVADKPGAGGASFMTSLIRRALRENQFVAVLDGNDSLDVTGIEEDLSRLLWIRCRAADEAMKASDLLLRDANIRMIVVDLMLNPAQQLRRISATTWYRFQRIIEQTSTVCVVMTPWALVSPARTRIFLRNHFALGALEGDADERMQELNLETVEVRKSGDARDILQSSA